MKRSLILVLLAYALPVAAAEQYSPTPSEMAMLPPYCADRIDNGVSAKSPWVAKLGRGNWLHIHHYCFALNFANRASRARKEQDKSANLQAAEHNYGYAIKATEPQFWLRPQMYVGFGKVRLQQKKVGDANRLFNEAIQLDPRFEQAYLALIELNRQTGQGKAGLEAATAGLRHLPDSKALKTAYRELGGKEPYPEPIAKPAPLEAVPVTAAVEEAPGGQADPAATAGKAEPAKDGAAAETVGADAGKGATGIPEGCRFCPPQETQDRWRGSFQKEKAPN